MEFVYDSSTNSEISTGLNFVKLRQYKLITFLCGIVVSVITIATSTENFYESNNRVLRLIYIKLPQWRIFLFLRL